jgi:uncharacterized membrane protein YebE (DUF533 family)
MYELKIQPEFLEKLSPDGKKWLARAMVGALVVDKTLDASEMPYMKEALGIVAENAEEKQVLLEAAKTRQVPDFGNLEVDREAAGAFFYYLVELIAADGKVKNSEVTYLTTICGKLGFPPETAKNALRWSRDLVKLNQERNLMIAALKQLRPVYA